MSNNSNVNMNSFSKLGASTYDGEEVGDGWPFEKSSFGPLCFFCFFPGKKNLVISQSYLCHKLEVQLLNVCVGITFCYSATTQTKLTNKSILFILVCGN